MARISGRIGPVSASANSGNVALWVVMVIGPLIVLCCMASLIIGSCS